MLKLNYCTSLTNRSNVQVSAIHEAFIIIDIKGYFSQIVSTHYKSISDTEEIMSSPISVLNSTHPQLKEISAMETTYNTYNTIFIKWHS